MIKIDSNGKINLGLQVLNKRIDNYHNINTVFSRISLFDQITFEEDDKISIDILNSENIPIEDNLIYKAAIKLQNRTKTNKGAKIQLRKNIPMGGGLGGGSSNAAATLFALTKLWDLTPSTNDLMIIAQSLGSDVPFFLQEGLASAGSRGEKLNYFKLNLPHHILLVNPNIHVSTPLAFSSLNRNTKQKVAINFKNILFRSLDNQSLLKEYIINDFEKTIFKVHPEIKLIKNKLYDLGAIFSLMSGSGSTVFGLFDTIEKAKSAKENFSQYTCHVCNFVI